MTKPLRNQMHVALLLGLVLSLTRANGADAKDSTSDPGQPARGSIEGVVTFQGEIPKSSISDDAGVQRDLLQVDQESRGLANVVVWLVASDSRLTEPPLETPRTPVLMDQRDHEFVPRVIAVLAGQPVKFSNSDPANHNVRTSSPQRKNEFNVFTGADGTYAHSFVADPQQKLVNLGCDIHPWMRGWVYVFDHRYFAVTDERGRFRISSVPAGKYTLVLRQPDIRYSREEPFTVANKQPTKVQIEIHAEDANKTKE